MTIRQRGAPKPGASKESSGKAKEPNDEKPKTKSAPFSGRFNPK